MWHCNNTYSTFFSPENINYQSYLGQVKWIPLELLSLFIGHDLDLQWPGWVVTASDRIVKVTDGIIRVTTGKFTGLGSRQVLDALVTLRERYRSFNNTCIQHTFLFVDSDDMPQNKTQHSKAFIGHFNVIWDYQIMNILSIGKLIIMLCCYLRKNMWIFMVAKSLNGSCRQCHHQNSQVKYANTIVYILITKHTVNPIQ